MRRLFLIRTALIGGVAVFAAITAYLRIQGGIPDATDPDTLKTLQAIRYVSWAFSAFAVVFALFFRGRVEAAKNEQDVKTALIVGWAPAQGAALHGIVQYFLGAPLVTMAVGVLTFAVVLLLLPIPDTRS